MICVDHVFSIRELFVKSLRLASLLEVGNNVLSILRLLESGKNHLVSLDEFLRILEPLHDVLIVPFDASLLVCARVRITLHGSGLVSVEAIKIGSLFVGTSFLDGVALGALGLEDLGSLLFTSSLLLGHFDVLVFDCLLLI